jgi:predicted GNAT family N-acyltransferase
MNAAKYEIRVAETAPDREACFRLRYDVYVAELGRQLEVADHDRKQLTDADDVEGIIVGVFSNGQAVATARLNIADIQSQFVEKYALKTALTAQNRVAIVSRLMICPTLRGTGVFKLLVNWLFALARRLAVTHAFIECREHLVRLYETIGFQLHAIKNGPFSLMTLRVSAPADLNAEHQVA